MEDTVGMAVATRREGVMVGILVEEPAATEEEGPVEEVEDMEATVDTDKPLAGDMDVEILGRVTAGMGEVILGDGCLTPSLFFETLTLLMRFLILPLIIFIAAKL